MFYRPGGSASRINAQYDTVFSNVVGGATGWLPVYEGNSIAINIARAALTFQSAAKSQITPSPAAPEVQVIMEMKLFGGDNNDAARPIDQWQNIVVATSRRAHRDGWARLRILNINSVDGTGVVMDMQVSRNGDKGGVA